MTHTLTIEPGEPDGYLYKGTLRFEDKTEITMWADNRARLLAKAQQTIQARTEQLRIVREVVTFDEFGEVIREPSEWSVKAPEGATPEDLYDAGVFPA